MDIEKFEQAKAELMEYAVGDNEYAKITTWEELSRWAIFEKADVDDRSNRLQHIIYQSEEEIDKGSV